MSIKSAIGDFCRGLSFIFGKPEEGKGDRQLAKISKILMATIPVAGVDRVRKELIKGVEGDMKRAVKKNPSATVDELVAPALETPDYMALLKDLDMNIEHLKVIAREVLGVSGEQQ